MADFKLGRVKFKWRGDWAVTTAYVLDDIVKYGGNAYVCIQNHTSPNNQNLFYTTPGTYTDYWQIHQEAIYFKGAYANSTWYKINDLVSYGGKQYRCTTAHTSASLVLDQSKFEQFSDGIIFRGDYASSTQYRLNDLVKYGGRTYRVTTEHSSAAGGDANIVLGNFTLYSEGLAFRGDYAVSTYYRLDDVVKWGAYQYKCTTAHTSGGALSDFAEGNFAVYSEGLQFEDSYNASTLYQKGDVVTYGGYSYVWINNNEGSGQTPADNSYWDVITTGFKALGTYVHGTVYKTGDTIKYGGNSYVCTANNTNEYPAVANGGVNSTYWQIVVEGFFYRGAYDAATVYNVGDVSRYLSTSYVSLKDRHSNTTPGSDATTWQVVAQGDSGSVLSTRGDLIVQDAAGAARLPMGLPGAFLTNDGDDLKWSEITGKNVIWVSPQGDDSYQGTEALPMKTLAKGLEVAKTNSITEIDITGIAPVGGTGGTPSVYDDVVGVASKEMTVATVPSSTTFTVALGTSTYAHTYVNGGVVTKADGTDLDVTNGVYVHGTGVITITTVTHGLSVGNKVRVKGLNYTCAKGKKTYPAVGYISYYRVTTDGSSIPTIEINDGGSGYNIGDKVTVKGTDLGGASDLTFTVKSVAGDIIRLKTGTFEEQLPLRVKPNVSIVGESLRNTRVKPASGTGTQIKTVEIVTNVSGAANATYKYVHQDNTARPTSYAVASVPSSTTVTINAGTSLFAHTYVDGGTLVKPDGVTELAITNAVYNNTTGIITLTTATHGLSVSDNIKVYGINYLCDQGSKTYPKSPGQGSVWTVIVEGGVATGVLTYHGGSDYAVGDRITLKAADVGNGGDLVLRVKSVEDNNASNFFLCNDANNIRNMTFTNLTGTKRSGGLYKVTVVDADTFTIALGTSAYAHTYVSGGSVIKVGVEGTVHLVSSATYVHGTGVLTINTATNHGLSTNDYATVGKMKFTCDLGEKVYPETGPYEAAIMSLDPSGNIALTSPYIQNCTSINAGACGLQIDGNLHGPHPTSYKSMLGNDFTQINSDGIGVHVIGAGRAETVSVFCYYCAKANYAESGGFIRALNCSHAYGEKGVVSSGTDSGETPVNIKTRGLMLKYDQTAFGGGATESDIDNSITVQGSGTATITGAGGATAVIFRTNISLNYLHIDTIVGNFVQGETCTITKEDSSTFTVDLDGSFGDSTAAQQGQEGPLIAVKAGTTPLNTSGVIKVASNLKFTGDSTYYRVGLVSEENTTAQTATVRLTASIGTSKKKVADTVILGTVKFSNIRLTGHDFLSIGTGDFTTTNYPGTPTQPADQTDEVTEENGGRVYWVSTDQTGDFRVGDLFKIEQATGTATLNADAFDLSGLNELQLGSIGAELGATINEFSTDATMSGNSNTAIPTENAIVGYVQRDQMGTGHLVPPTGTTAQRPTGGDLKTGGIRYNSSLVTWEGYNGTQWTGLGGGNPWASMSSSATVAANDRYFVDTSSAAITATLPAAPQVGDQVSFVDLAGTFDTNNLTIGRNSLKIMGAAADLVVSTEDAGIQLVYTGTAQGWKLTQNF